MSPTLYWMLTEKCHPPEELLGNIKFSFSSLLSDSAKDGLESIWLTETPSFDSQCILI